MKGCELYFVILKMAYTFIFIIHKCIISNITKLTHNMVYLKTNILPIPNVSISQVRKHENDVIIFRHKLFSNLHFTAAMPMNIESYHILV